ncbi:hypothetical protein COV21_02295 [Candidatus Woesearchaeota archaeon CG10_big_fil_rev_8_21_14_0_10_45_5]|jgi:hypothetical protein|nr:MAG: hypothetical protein COV21_02295 [Candidatus Woesearchaeota archaeon CG10_big_fil_rev_8_21_14_0_10_45_5]PIU29915.1 MAG: hypothetical protein COT07_03475 [Candidatus Woesearchaeota archaeon CG07_land_8_20_14_0_80_44_23]
MKEKKDYKKKSGELEKRISELEEWFSVEIKKRDRRIEELEREKALFMSSAMKEAEKRQESQFVMEKMKDRFEKMQNILRDERMKSKK